MIRVFSFNITAEEQNTINKIIKFFAPETVTFIDLRCYEPESTSEDIMLLFGTKAIKICGNLSCKIKEEFPELSKLSPGFGEEYEREQANNKLKLIKKSLAAPSSSVNKAEISSSSNETTTKSLVENLPDDISSRKILEQVEIIIKNKQQKAWIITTKDNKIVRVTLSPESSNADIDITFAELYMLKTTMEVFQVKELEVVYNSKFSKQTNTT